MRRHGHATGGKVSPTYNSWRCMKERCERPGSASYPRYGAVGIKVCDRWKRFKNFLKDMGERPEGKYLSRRDHSKGYEPGNVVWARCGGQGC